MWVQAATTMSTYQAISGAALAAAPAEEPAPPIETAHADHDDGGDEEDGQDDDGGIVDNDGGDPTQLSWWFNRITEVYQTLARDLADFPENPAESIEQLQAHIPLLVADEVEHLGEAINTFTPELQALTFALPVAGLGGFAGLSGLSGLAAIAPAATPAMAAALPSSTAAPAPPAVATSPVATVTPAPAPSPASPAVSATGSAPAGPPPPPSVAGAGGAAFPYLVGGPGAGFGSSMSTRVARKASEPDLLAAPAAAAAAVREQQRARRRRRAALQDRGHRYEYLGSSAGPEPQAQASDRGAGSLGFAGTVGRGASDAAGLAVLAGDGFGGGPAMPMLPGSWDPDDPTTPPPGC